MYKLACHDVGVENCSFVARGRTAEDVAKMAMDHLKMVHSDKWREMSASLSPAEITAKLEELSQPD